MIPKRVNGYLLDPSSDPSSIGSLIRSQGLVSEDEFDNLLSQFQNLTVGQLLGEFMVSKEKLTKEQLDLLLIKQRQMRNGGRTSHRDVMDAIGIAQRTGQRRDTELVALASCIERTNGK